ncbi:MAG: 30S ribosomal protein S6 [Planctomycetota bacterium]
MDTVVKRLYEGLFLVDSGEATADWKGINNAIEAILAKADAEITSLNKWDERKLAYDINGKSRGTYILAYFQGDPAKIGEIERAVQLSEQIMRVMILRTDKMSSEDMEKETPQLKAEKAEIQEAKPAETKPAETKPAEAQAAAPAKSEEPSNDAGKDEQAVSEEPSEAAPSDPEPAGQ